MDTSVLTEIAQFGAAGLIAWMWLWERRGAVQREMQLTEAHARVLEQRVQLDALLSVVQENTRAVAALEAGQRVLGGLLERLGGGRGPSAGACGLEKAGSTLGA